MSGDRLRDTMMWLLIAATAVFLAERLFVVLAFFAYPLLLFGLAWLLSLVLYPLAQRLTQLEIPVPLVVHRVTRNRFIPPIWRISPSLAVTLVFTGMIAIVSTLIISLVPALGPQLVQLSETMPAGMAALSSWIASSEDQLRRWGFRGDLSAVLQPEALSEQIGALGSSLVQQSLGIAGSIATLLFGTFVVMILSFYMTLDGPRMAERVIGMMPSAWRDEARHFLGLVDRVFGGFLRAQLLQSLIYGLATAVVMVMLGISEVALASVLAAILVAIPLIGGLFALIPPLLFTLVQAPDRTLLMALLLFLAQQILFNMIMPRLMGKSVGLHPLLVFAAMLIGGTLAGGWGLLFGIPIAGVIASALQFIYNRANPSRI